MNLDALHIAHPELVHGLWLWALLVGLLVWLEQRGSDSLNRLVGRALEDRLVEGPAPWRRWLRLALVALAGFLMLLALMRPQWGERFVATPRVGAEIMIALDVSRSMLADDAKPSRLERAKAEISDLLAYLENDQVGLIAFAGRASILSPMTPDRSFLRLALDGAGPHSVSRGGTRLAEPILRAVTGLGEPGPAQRALILITDGEDHDSFALDAAKKAAEAGIKIITIGFGDEAGSPIFVQDPDDGSRTQVRDSEGNPVISRLDGDLLREIALATDGAYVPAGMGVLDLASIYDAHIARLTRGQLDARGRSIRGELYQGFVAAALICLVLGASATAGSARQKGSAVAHGRASAQAEGQAKGQANGSPRAAGSATLASAAFALALAATFVPVSAPLAQVAGDPAAAPALDASEAPAAAPGPIASPPAAPAAQSAVEVATPPDEDPRMRFNRANERLAADDPALASTLYREARRDAVDDLQLRYAASYNLGMAAVAQADSVQANDPSEALARLHEAADWFREASAMQPDEDDPRHNLDVTLRRALILADEIARKSQRDLEGVLDRLIETQRGRVGETALLLESVARAVEPGAVDALRPAFDAAATAQRELLADGEDLAERAANEKAILDAKAPDARSPEDALRGASLEGVLRYLDQGVERMGQARRQLRLRSAERAYRRGSEALDSLKRARDQLRDPVEQIGVLIGEVEGVGRATASLAGAAASPEGVETLPAFLTPEQIGGETAAVEARVGELAERFTTAAEQAATGAVASPSAGSTQAAGDSPNESPSIPESLRAALQAAAPLIRDAHSALGRATAALAEKKFEPALAGDGEAIEALGEARELFFDLRQLLAVSYEAESRIAGVARTEDANVLEQRARVEAALAAEQSRNRNRAIRLETLLAAEREAALEALESPDPATAPDEDAVPTPPDPARRAALEQRFEWATTLLAEAASAMDEAGSAFATKRPGTSVGKDTGAARATDWPRVGVAAGRAAERLDALRMLFSTLLEQLQRLERDQIDLSDRTRDAIALAAVDEPADERSAETRGRVGAIDGEQRSLESRAGAIADALVARSEAVAADPATAGADASSGEAAEPDAATLRRAADHVATAQLSMRSAGETFADESLPLPPAAAAQTVAREELRKALELLSPPPQEKPEEPQQQEPQAGEEESAPDPAEPEPEPGEGGEQQEPQAGADEKASASEDEGAQLLQGVRDREAERRAANERKARNQRRSAPVEKDW